MAQFIAVDPNLPLGAQVVGVNDLLFQLERAVNELVRPLDSLAQDDNTYAEMAAQLGLASTDDAFAVYQMLLEARNRLATAENGSSDSAFMQLMKRVSQQTP